MFDGKSFDDWRIKMQTIYGFQDVVDVMLDELHEMGLKATEEEKRNHKAQKIDSKARFLLYQCVKMQTLRRQFECLAMKDNDTVANYFDRMQEHVNVICVYVCVSGHNH